MNPLPRFTGEGRGGGIHPFTIHSFTALSHSFTALSSFDILDLFAHLLDQQFEIHGHLRYRHVRRF